MRVLFDTNVILDIALNREPFVTASAAALRRCETNSVEMYVAWHSLSNLFYVLRKDRGAEKTTEFIEWLLSIMRVPTVGHADALAALTLGIADFEDALQMSAAGACAADVLVTRNVADFKNCSANVLTPEDFLVS